MTLLAQPMIRWDAGGEAEITAHADVHLTVRSTRPFPPGAPVPGTLTAHTSPLALALKVAATRKVADGVWEIRGRLISATRELLDALARLAPPPPAP